MIEIAGIEMNLNPFNVADANDGMDLFHNNGSSIIPAFLVIWRKPENIAGSYSKLPYIQYLNEDGENYTVRDGPAWFKQFMPVSPLDLLVDPDVDS